VKTVSESLSGSHAMKQWTRRLSTVICDNVAERWRSGGFDKNIILRTRWPPSPVSIVSFLLDSPIIDICSILPSSSAGASRPGSYSGSTHISSIRGIVQGLISKQGLSEPTEEGNQDISPARWSLYPCPDVRGALPLEALPSGRQPTQPYFYPYSGRHTTSPHNLSAHRFPLSIVLVCILTASCGVSSYW
jgi:hypothetical protein